MQNRFRGVVLIALLFVSVHAHAIDIGADIPVDKRLHALSTYVIADVLHERFELSGLDLFLAVNAIGISKEVLDEAYGGEFDTNDIVANNVGYMCYNVIRIKF